MEKEKPAIMQCQADAKGHKFDIEWYKNSVPVELGDNKRLTITDTGTCMKTIQIYPFNISIGVAYRSNGIPYWIILDSWLTMQSINKREAQEKYLKFGNDIPFVSVSQSVINFRLRSAQSN